MRYTHLNFEYGSNDATKQCLQRIHSGEGWEQQQQPWHQLALDMSTAISCVSCDTIQFAVVAVEVSSLDQFCSIIPYISPGNTNSQPDYAVLSEVSFLLKSAKT